MKSYLTKRLLLFIPGLLVISLFIFALSKIAPGSPVDQLVFENEKSSKDHLSYLKQVEELNRKFNFDKPSFYWTIRSRNSVENFVQIIDSKALHAMNSLSNETNAAESVASYYKAIEKLKLNSNATELQTLKRLSHLNSLEKSKNGIQAITNQNQKGILSQKIQEIEQGGNAFHAFIPIIQWNGFNNQYHLWLSGILKGDFGKSYFDGKSVSSKILSALPWTLTLSIIALILAFAIAIPAGVKSASKPNSLFDKICTNLFFGFYALPSFWVATLLIVFLCNPDFLNIFPSYGVGDISQSNSFFEQFQIRLSHLILPLFCWTYGSLAYIYRQSRRSMQYELQSDYSKTAYMKGLSESQVRWKHAFKNASFPLITILGTALPALFSGSFIIESIFSIPGMGTLSLQALFTRDYPVLFGVFMLIAFLTLLGILIADILYYKADPRLKLKME